MRKLRGNGGLVWEMQYCKAAIHNCSTDLPEMMPKASVIRTNFVKFFPNRFFLTSWINFFARGGCLLEISVKEAMGPASMPVRGINLDDGDGKGCELLGSGLTLSIETEKEHAALRQVWIDVGWKFERWAGIWPHVHIELGHMLKYDNAVSRGERNEIIHSKAYRRPTVFASYYRLYVRSTRKQEEKLRSLLPVSIASSIEVQAVGDCTAPEILWKDIPGRGRLYTGIYSLYAMLYMGSCFST